MIRRSLMLIAAGAFVVGVCWKIHAQSSAPVFTATQYVAVVVGYGGVQPSTFAGLIPEISLPVARSSAIWVFELP